jgi:hypothetical protein
MEAVDTPALTAVSEAEDARASTTHDTETESLHSSPNTVSTDGHADDEHSLQQSPTFSEGDASMTPALTEPAESVCTNSALGNSGSFDQGIVDCNPEAEPEQNAASFDFSAMRVVTTVDVAHSSEWVIAQPTAQPAATLPAVEASLQLRVDIAVQEVIPAVPVQPLAATAAAPGATTPAMNRATANLGALIASIAGELGAAKERLGSVKVR